MLLAAEIARSSAAVWSTLIFMKARVIVMPKRTVLDPQGVAVRDAVHHLGLAAASSVRVGKYLEIQVDSDEDRVDPGSQAAHALCRDLLSNPVIEDYRLELGEGLMAPGQHLPSTPPL